jgi:hypothetical protein
MQPAKLSTVLACLLGAVLLGTALDAVLNLGDSFKGNLGVDDEDIVQFAGLKGEKIGVTVKADKGQGLLPAFRIVDLTTSLEVVFLTTSGKNKVSVKKIELPTTGLYQIHITSFEKTIGSYTLKTKGKLSKAVLRPSNSTAIGPKETQETPFDSKGPAENAPEGSKDKFTLNGTIASTKKSGAIPFNPTLSGPEEGDPIELTGFITKSKKGKFTIKGLELPELGTYVLSVQNQGLSGVIKTKLKLKKPKVKKQTFEEGL